MSMTNEMMMVVEKVLAGELKGMKVDQLAEIIVELWESRGGKEGKRKGEVLALLEGKPMQIGEIAEALGITSRNVSSILSGLKKDGYILWNDEEGRKMLKGRKAVEQTQDGEGAAE